METSSILHPTFTPTILSFSYMICAKSR